MHCMVGDVMFFNLSGPIVGNELRNLDWLGR